MHGRCGPRRRPSHDEHSGIATDLNLLGSQIQFGGCDVRLCARSVGISIVMLVYRPHGWHAWIGVVFWIVVVAAIAAIARVLWRLRK